MLLGPDERALGGYESGRSQQGDDQPAESAHSGRQRFINGDRVGQLVKMPLALGDGITLLVP